MERDTENSTVQGWKDKEINSLRKLRRKIK